MRAYDSFTEAMNEIRRDVAEMGHEHHTRSYQDKVIEGDPGMVQKELTNYAYLVTRPDPSHLQPTQPWADVEFEERVSGRPLNPGTSYLQRIEVWKDFLITTDPDDPHFHYTYPERMAGQLEEVVSTLQNDRGSRQAYLSVWEPRDCMGTGARSRIPCSLGYWLSIRRDKLSLTYHQRSADLATHLQNDVWMASKLQRWFADRLNAQVGEFVHWLGSLHVFAKDVKGVF